MNTTDLRNTDRTIAQIITDSGRGWREWEIADRLGIGLWDAYVSMCRCVYHGLLTSDGRAYFGVGAAITPA